MHFLYNTPLIKYIEDWLDSDDLDLLTTGVLALGNFARTDTHCISMVDTRVAHKLLAILARNNATSDDMRLQHALLSTLRNLVIPKPNKAAVVEAGLVQTILPMLQIHQPPVVFKLLGTLRMTVDGQEKLALELLQNGTLIAQLVHWSRASEFASVTGESLRLMAWLIKHAYFRSRHAEVPSTKTDAAPEAAATASAAHAPPAVDDSSLRAFVRTDGAVECMVGMLTSQHLVMQNEALIALSILSSVIGSNDTASAEAAQPLCLDAVLEQSELGARLAEFITKSADTMTKEIVENLQTLVGLLRRSETLVVHLGKHNIDELLKTIPILTEYCTL